jgi:hypothetical protein
MQAPTAHVWMRIRVKGGRGKCRNKEASAIHPSHLELKFVTL